MIYWGPLPVIIASWYTSDYGNYDYTAYGLSGGYTVHIASQNDAAGVKPFLTPKWIHYPLAVKAFGVLFGADINFSPNIGGQSGWAGFCSDCANILTKIRKSKIWTLNNFNYTKNWTEANYPSYKLFGAFGTFYFPILDEVFYHPDDIWGENGKYTVTHEWTHSLMMSVFIEPNTGNPKIPLGWTWREHGRRSITNPCFAFAEGFAEFYESTIWCQEYPSTNQSPMENYYVSGELFAGTKKLPPLNLWKTIMYQENLIIRIFLIQMEEQRLKGRLCNFSGICLMGGAHPI